MLFSSLLSPLIKSSSFLCFFGYFRPFRIRKWSATVQDSHLAHFRGLFMFLSKAKALLTFDSFLETSLARSEFPWFIIKFLKEIVQKFLLLCVHKLSYPIFVYLFPSLLFHWFGANGFITFVVWKLIWWEVRWCKVAKIEMVYLY